MSKASLLVDVRESADLRGFHALAALQLVADQLHSVDLYRLGGESEDERIACQSFTFDTGLSLRSCESLSGRQFDVYLSAADAFPWDDASVAARGAARRTVAPIMFGLRDFQPAFAGLALSGHDTAAIADAVLAELGRVSPGERQ